jgi:hypothetical protein
MYSHKHYVMHDQVRGLIPELMRTDARGIRRAGRSFAELLFFSGAISLYLIALGLSN